jgi:hypothetical protein
MLGYYRITKKIKKSFLSSNFQESYNFDFEKASETLNLIGNGYTIKNLNITCFDGVDSFICNNFFRMQGFDEFIEKNNVLDFSMDSFEFFFTRANKLNSTREILLEEYVNPKIGLKLPLVKTSDFIQYIIEKYPNQSIITDKALLKKFITNSNKKIINKIKKNIGHTPQFMLLIGILMGYKKIYLYGLEHNYVKDILNKSTLCGTHFYDDTYEDVMLSDGHKRGDRESAKIKLSKLFEENAKIFRGYEQLADLAKEMGVEIIDHSNGSLFMFQDYSLWDLVEDPKLKK